MKPTNSYSELGDKRSCGTDTLQIPGSFTLLVLRTPWKVLRRCNEKTYASDVDYPERFEKVYLIDVSLDSLR